ncbi:trithorax group protein osa-like [Iris pallida]|uniref:Trithorax group protein osa-like n=1 Tax=Iris pallida TaxID=29817 RepID=A0AAX6GAA9_IRIPA|nr:trithorax group protein osa-like [Iris pallida]
MGFDNECIVDIQSLPGEYFCPVCRTLIYPNESLQAQCTHLYCKPCLAYVVATTHACPYDGYLVTEADAKPLIESNKELSESIGKVAVHCLYHRSGCQWQGTLAECTTHCTGCNYGNSPVVCNRCGTQIVHSQVQEHAQICPGVQPQTQQVENAQPQAAAVPNQAAAQDPSATASIAAPLTAAAPTTTTAAAAAASSSVAAPAAMSAPAAVPSAAAAAPAQAQVQGGVAVYPQPPSAEQWYQQQQLQYQQYYQQYPGYDPYQQQYQQYAQYQQQAHPQYMQPQMQAAQHVVPGQQQPQLYMHPQPQSQPQPQPQPQPHAQPLPPQQTKHQVAQPQQQQQQQLSLQPHQQLHPQTQLQPHQHPLPHPQPHMQAQIPQMQAQPHVPAQQPQAQPPPHGQIAGQPHPQSHQLHPLPQPQARPPQLPGPPQQQQAVPPQQHPPAQMPYPQSHPQQQLRPQHPPPQNQQLAMQPQQHPQPHLQTIPQTQTSHPPSHAVSGHHSYPQPIAGAPQPRPMQMPPPQSSMPPPYQQSQHPPQMQGQFPPQQPPQMRPPHAQMPMQVQQQPAMAPPQIPPANLHPGQQQVQQPMHQAGMQPHAPQHGFPHSQPQGHLHPGQMQQQGAVPPQQLYPQQPFRPQGPAYMQHQTQARPMVPNQGVPQQPFQQSLAGGTKLIQPGQSPNHAYPARSTSQVPQSSELHQSQVPHSGNQVPASPATSKQGTSLPGNSGQVAQSESGMTIKAAEGAETGENLPDHVSDHKSTGKEDKLTVGVKEKGAQAENDSKEHLESEKGHESLVTKENVDGKMTNQVKGKEEEVTETSNEENKGHDRRPNEKSVAQVQGEVAHPMQDGNSNVHPHAGADKVLQRPNLDNMHTQQMPAPGGLARGQSGQPANQTTLPAQERGMSHPGYHDRNASQFPQQYPPARGPFPNQEKFPPQQVPHGHPPNMTDPTIVSQRPPAPDRMFPQPMQVHGPTKPPTQMRPSLPGHNQMESFPQQGQTTLAPEPFWPNPHAGGPGSGLPPPPAGVPLHQGLQHNTFHQQSMPPAGQSHSHMPPPNAGGARGAPGEPLTRSAMVGPPPGALEAPSRMPGGGVGQSPPVNPMEPESYAIRRPGVHDSRQPEPHRPLPDEHAPYRQPGDLKMNGMPNKAYIGGMHDSTFGPGMGEDRFRSLPEERFKPFPGEGFNTPQDRFRPSTLDPGRHVNRREFEEDLKQFPRPAYLDEGPKFDGYMSDRAPHVSGGTNLTTSRPLPSYQSGPPFPPRSEGERDRPMLHEHMGRKHDTTVADHLNATPEFGRPRMDGLPPIRSPRREYDGFSSSNFGLRGQSHREDFEERDQHGFAPRFKSSNFPPPGSAYFGKDIPDGSGSLRSNQLRGLDGPDISNIHPHAGGAPGHGFGGSGSFSGIGEHGRPGSLPSHMRFGESGGFNGYFNSVSREGDVDSFEQSTKRKPGSMGWCRICKIDCMTVEGLDLHSQTREHQNMTMDLVMSIKQDNAKKHKLNSEKAISFEDENRSRKMNFENRRKRQ